MITLQIIITLLVFIILLVADMHDWRLSAGLLFMFFAFGLLAFDITDKQAIFYALGIVFFMATKAAMERKLQTNADGVDLKEFGSKGLISGFKYHMLSIMIGLGMLLVMFYMTKSKGQFLGVAPLSISSGGIGAWLTVQFAPAISLALGFIENRMFIALLNLLTLSQDILVKMFSLIPFLGVILAGLAFSMPVILTCLTFGIFHIVAYAIVWKLIIWASMIMFMWIISYYLTGKDTTAMDTAHGGWNGWLTTKDTLAIIT